MARFVSRSGARAGGVRGRALRRLSEARRRQPETVVSTSFDYHGVDAWKSSRRWRPPRSRTASTREARGIVRVLRTFSTVVARRRDGAGAAALARARRRSGLILRACRSRHLSLSVWRINLQKAHASFRSGSLDAAFEINRSRSACASGAVASRRWTRRRRMRPSRVARRPYTGGICAHLRPAHALRRRARRRRGFDDVPARELRTRPGDWRGSAGDVVRRPAPRRLTRDASTAEFYESLFGADEEDDALTKKCRGGSFLEAAGVVSLERVGSGSG